MMTREKVELALIAGAGATALAAAPLLPSALPAGSVALTASALLLGQGLLRDLWLKYGPAQAPAAPSTCSRASMCVESGLGVLGIAAGGLLLAAGAGGQVALGGPRWAGLVWTVGAGGFLLKDVVVDLRARRVRIEKDHRSVVVW